MIHQPLDQTNHDIEQLSNQMRLTRGCPAGLTKAQIQSVMHCPTISDAAHLLEVPRSNLSCAHKRHFECDWNSEISTFFAICCKLQEVGKLDCLVERDDAKLAYLGSYFQTLLLQMVQEPDRVIANETEHKRSLDRAHRLHSKHYFRIMIYGYQTLWDDIPTDYRFGFEPFSEEETSSRDELNETNSDNNQSSSDDGAIVAIELSSDSDLSRSSPSPISRSLFSESSEDWITPARARTVCFSPRVFDLESDSSDPMELS